MLPNEIIHIPIHIHLVKKNIKL